jgi:hypothetical protein
LCQFHSRPPSHLSHAGCGILVLWLGEAVSPVLVHTIVIIMTQLSLLPEYDVVEELTADEALEATLVTKAAYTKTQKANDWKARNLQGLRFALDGVGLQAVLERALTN